MTRIAGPGVGFADGPLASAKFGSWLNGMAADPSGSAVFVSDRNNGRVRKVDLVAGTVSTYATISNAGYLAMGGDGALFVAAGEAPVPQSTEDGPDKIWRIPPGGGVPQEHASGFFRPWGIAFTSDGTMWVGECKVGRQTCVPRLSKVQGSTRTTAWEEPANYDVGVAAVATAGNMVFFSKGKKVWRFDPATPFNPGDPTAGAVRVGGADDAEFGLAADRGGSALYSRAADGVRRFDLGQAFPGTFSNYAPTPAGSGGIAVCSECGLIFFSDNNGGLFRTTGAEVAGGGLSAEETNGCNDAAPGVNGSQGEAGDPINTQTGNFFDEWTDLSIGTRGRPLEVRRTYNSARAAVSSPLGFGWSFSYGSRLDNPNASSGQQVVYQQGCGPVTRFTRQADGSYVAPGRVTADLVRNGDGSFVLSFPDGARHRFDASGRLTASETAAGQVTTLGYDAGGLDRVTAPDGRFLDFTVVGGRVSRVVDPAQRYVAFGYSGAGDLTQVTVGQQTVGGDQPARSWGYGYDGGHRLTDVFDPDQMARAVPDRRSVHTDYDGLGRAFRQTDELGGLTELTFDHQGLPGQTLVAEPVAGSGSTRRTKRLDVYANGVRVSTTVGVGSANPSVWSFTYDPVTVGVTSVTGPGQRVVARTEFDPVSGRPTRVTDAAGTVTTMAWNSVGLPTQVVEGANDAAIASTTTYTYATGSPWRLDRVDVTGNAGPRTTTFSYTKAGQPTVVTEVIDPRSQSWQFDYDANGYRTKAAEPPIGGARRTTTWAYDNVGRLTSTVAPNGNKAGGTPALYTTTVVPDLFGAPTRITDPLAGLTVRGYTPSGLVDVVTDANGQITDHGYDDASRLVEVQTKAGSTVVNTLRNTYWGDGLLRAQLDNAGVATTYDYDAQGRPETVTDPAGRVTRYAYTTTTGDLASKQAPGGNCATGTACTRYGYDAAGRVTAIDYSDATPDVTAVAYDARSRRVCQAVAGVAGSCATPTTGPYRWAWDSAGNLTSTTAPAGGTGAAETIGYTYDAGDNLTAIAYPGGNCTTTPTSLCVRRGYDPAGRIDWIDDFAGRRTDYNLDYAPTGDPNDRLRVSFPTSTATVDEFVADRTGATDQVTFDVASATDVKLDYGRRPAGQLSSMNQLIGGGLPGAGSETYGYDGVGRLASVTPGGGAAQTYDYDRPGNLSKLVDGTQLVADPANQLCYSTPSTRSACATPPADATTYGFDGRGNRTSVDTPTAAPSTYGYDLADRLTSVAQPRPVDNGGQYKALAAPARLLDTRAASRKGLCPTALSQCTSYPSGGGERVVQVSGQGGLPSTGVSAVALNVTVLPPAAGGSATVYPADVATRPVTSNVTVTAGQEATNMVVTRLSPDGRVKVHFSTAGNVLVDVVGWYSTPTGQTGGELTAVNPAPLLDTRSANRVGLCPTSITQCTTLAANTSRTVQVTGQGGVPSSGVSQVVVNVTALNGTGQGLLQVYGANQSAPGTITVAYNAGTVESSLAFVPVSADGRITITSSFAGADVRVDVQGWVSPSSGPGSVFTPVAATRVVDTTTGTGPCTPACTRFANGDSRTVTVAGQAGLPTSGTTAVMVNLTTVNPSGDGFFKGYRAGDPPPAGITMNYDGAETTSMLAIIPVSADGRITLTNAFAATDLRLAITGYYTDPLAPVTTTYTYDGDGLRRAKQHPFGTTTYTWSPAEGLPLLLVETTNGTPTYYIYGPDGLPIESVTNGTPTFFHHDQLGSTRALTNLAGQIIGRATYDPYGRPTAIEGATTPFGYAGQYTDPETGFQYLRARFYDPATGQFLTRDPINALTRSAYGYVYGNPLNKTDPTGLYCLSGVKGHDSNGDEICNGAGEVTHNAVNATVVTATHGQADCVMGLTCDEGAKSVVSSATGGAACSRFMDAGCTEPLAEARAQICPAFGCVAVTWDGHNLRHHEGLGPSAGASVGLSTLSSCEPHESFWGSWFVFSGGADHSESGWSPSGGVGAGWPLFGGGVVHWFN